MRENCFPPSTSCLSNVKKQGLPSEPFKQLNTYSISSKALLFAGDVYCK